MSEKINSLIAALLESEEDDDAGLVKDISGQTPDEWLTSAGFQREEQVWVKRMAEQAVTVANIPGGYYSIGYYRRNEGDRWVPVSRSDTDVTGLMRELEGISSNPVVEAVGEEDDDFDYESDVRDVLGQEDKQEIFQFIDGGILSVSGNVYRPSSHYVHENTTTCHIDVEWLWDRPETSEQEAEQQSVEQRVDAAINRIEGEMAEDLRRWNRKIYREIEQSHESYISDENVAENIQANEYKFDEDGDWNGDEFVYDQLSPEAQEKARNWWIENLDQNDWEHMAEPVILEWRWLLKNKGFTGVKISWSGFGSQGDGASFTADSIDLKLYLTGPDPMEFPEQNREQLSEDLSDDDDEGLRDVYDVNRKQIAHIQSASDYAEYEARVADFFDREGVTNLSSMVDQHGNVLTDEFSRTPCDVCRRPLAGARASVSGYNPKTREVSYYDICPDCEYYAEYGQLDDTTMMDLKKDIGESEEDFDTKEVLEEPPEKTFKVVSSHGEIEVSLDTGRVVKMDISSPEDPESESIRSIERFDLDEWRRFYNEERIEPGWSMDILDMGYWLKNGAYEPPVEDWRQEFAAERHKRGTPPQVE